MTIHFGHAEDRLRQYGVQSGPDPKQIAAVGDEVLERLGVREIQATGQTGQDHSQAEDIRQRVVVSQFVLPRDVARQIDGAGDRRSALADGQIDHFVAAGRQIARAAQFGHDFHRRLAGRFDRRRAAS